MTEDDGENGPAEPQGKLTPRPDLRDLPLATVSEPDADGESDGAGADPRDSPETLVERLAWPCLVAVAAVVCGLLLAAPALSHFIPGGVYVVASDSMEPTIPTGSLVYASPGEPEVGDVVVYEAVTGRLEVHRVVDEDRSGAGTTYTTQGDNNAAADSYIVEASQVQGEVSFHLPYLGGFWLLPLWLRGLLLGAGASLFVIGELSEDSEGSTAPTARPGGQPVDGREQPGRQAGGR